MVEKSFEVLDVGPYSQLPYLGYSLVVYYHFT